MSIWECKHLRHQQRKAFWKGLAVGYKFAPPSPSVASERWCPSLWGGGSLLHLFCRHVHCTHWELLLSTHSLCSLLMYCSSASHLCLRIPTSLHTTSVMLWAQRAPLLLFVYTYPLFHSQVRDAVHILFPFPAILLLTGVGVVIALKELCKVIFS